MTEPSAAVPTFGADAPHDTHPFRVAIYDPEEEASLTEEFLAWKDPGGGAILAFMRSGADPGRQIQAAARLLYDALVDTDGLQIEYVPPGQDEVDPETGDPLPVDPRLADITQWSSRRRFSYYSDSSRYRVPSDVIVDVADWLTREAFQGRPTARPSRSSRGPKSTGRGSGGRSSSKA